ncbi:zinc finger BED domain-containing protein DAYSLEEPER-like [Olea europaea var. sylvestris]|uniref:zinc finger BED domain-containing protein DAYSLEEPER-like n=1 Tax=Olea europaea var. sylvestris TaxID=158386 RepID=UPI000C1D585F|nr:zinc finger BED domain-containing protein DAYSLEEPER-like [Olea europaea var. sylvestris]
MATRDKYGGNECLSFVFISFNFIAGTIEHVWSTIKEAYGKVSIGTYSFDQDNARRELGNMIILYEYPLLMVEYIGFRRFMNTLQPLFKNVSRNTIKNGILKIYDYKKLKVMSLLEKNNGKITITTDMWTSNQKKGFVAITVHFIDEVWKLQS